MVREGKDNIKGQAWFGWYTEQLALRACLKSLRRLVQWVDERKNLSKRPD
jgi:hypothetical protein